MLDILAAHLSFIKRYITSLIWVYDYDVECSKYTALKIGQNRKNQSYLWTHWRLSEPAYRVWIKNWIEWRHACIGLRTYFEGDI